MVVPSGWTAGKNVHLEASNNAKVMSGALHCLEKLWMVGIINADGGSIRQNDVELAKVIADHAIKPFMTSVSTTEAGTHHSDIVIRARGCDIALIP